MSRISVVRTDAGRYPQVSSYCRDVLLESLPDNVCFVEIDQHSSVNEFYTACNDYHNFFVNLLCGLNQCPPGPVFLVDYDCLYPPGYFSHEVVSGAVNLTYDMIYLNSFGFFPRELPTTSVVSGYRDFLRELIWIQLKNWDESPRTIAKIKDERRVFHTLDIPAVDVRHGKNWSGNRSGEFFQEHSYWGSAKELYSLIIGE